MKDWAQNKKNHPGNGNGNGSGYGGSNTIDVSNSVDISLENSDNNVINVVTDVVISIFN